MATTTQTWKTTDEIATLLATHKDGSIATERAWYLSQKQTSWLIGQASREGRYRGRGVHGTLANGATWSCHVSPVNHCGFFRVGQDQETYTAQQEAERVARRAELEAVIAKYQSVLPGGAEYDARTPEQKAILADMLPFVREQLARGEAELAAMGE